MAAKKVTPTKTILKKTASKKTASKKAKGRKPSTVSPKPKKADPKNIIPQGVIEETPISGDCMCKQKRPNGKYFCFQLVQGRWIQSSGVPFPTKELCEEANC